MQHGYFVEDCFLTLNYHNRPILNLELQNRTSFTSQLFFFLRKLHRPTIEIMHFFPLDRNHLVSVHITRTWHQFTRQLLSFYLVLSLSFLGRWAVHPFFSAMATTQ